MEKYSDTSPCIVDGDVVRLKMKASHFGGMWDQDIETRQSKKNAAYGIGHDESVTRCIG